ncbi:laccase-3 [Dorcoceras hygrometricum]|uniref:Laccase-3 n=1 Tax=Dorcoceras hygrometricum TaxID=472368 RepID=A0A2Z7BV59_9LAMI|nr:laccase-3 [Dorcoceras hygrometricum]
MDSSRKTRPEQFSGEATAAAGGARRRRREEEEERGAALKSLVLDLDRPNGPGCNDEHSVHLHHRDFIITPIADQIGPIDSVSKTERYDLKNRFSEPQCKMTVLPLNSGKPRVSMTFRVVSTNQYNQDLGLIHSTNGNHLESPKEGSSIDHQVTIYLHAQNITMFPTTETWYFASQILVSNSGGLILILTAQSTRNMFRIHSDY